MGEPIEKISDDELVNKIEAINDETLRYLKKMAENPDPEIAERAKFQVEIYSRVLVLLERVEQLIIDQKFDEAEAASVQFLDEVKSLLEGKKIDSVVIENAIREIQDFVNIYGAMVEATELKEPSAKMELLSVGLDVLPFVGGAKMMAEGAVGRSLTGEKLSAGGRAMKVAEGGLWLTVDTAATVAALATAPAGGAGGAAVEGAAMAAKGAEIAFKAPRAAKLITRSAALIRATEGAGEGSRALYNIGRFLVEHPTVGKSADKLVARGVEARRAALLAAPGKALAAGEAQRNSVELIEAVNTERQELVDALGTAFDARKQAA